MSFSFLKPRTLFWLLKALTKRYHRSLFWGFAVGLVVYLFISFAYPLLQERFQKPEIKRIGISGDYTSTNLPLKIQNLVSLGLTSLTSTGEATPAAAQKWEIKDEGKIYLFHLRPEIFWQDGTKFSAHDVNYSLKDAEMTALDEATLEIKLKEPFSPLPVLLSQPLFKEGFVGLGEYQVESIKIQDGHLSQLTLIPVESIPEFPILQYKFYPNEEKLALAYKLGEIDIMEDLTDLSFFLNWPIKLEPQVRQDRHLALFYNVENELLSSKVVRQALTYALPKIDQERISSPLSGSSWVYNEKLKKYEPDLELAKKLFNQTETATKATTPKITLSTDKTFQELALQIKRSWERLGLEVELSLEKDIPQNFQALLAVQEIPPDPDQYSLWHSTQKKTNITGYKNPRIDKLLEDGRKITDLEGRKKKYLDFQKYLTEDLPAVFLYHPTTYTLSRP